jgi:geranylgeranyl diphosphate synthase type II
MSSVTDHTQTAGVAPWAESQAGVRQRVDAFLDGYLSSLTTPADFDAALRYALLGPGKRVRPVLCVFSCVAAGGSPEAALPAAGALEMVHAFSLVHDDLPALDDDDMRRGRETTHKAFGEATAILAGDGLLALAFRLLTDRSADHATAGRLCAALAAGTSRMVDGQVLDTLGEQRPVESEGEAQERLLAIHRNKTGALIRAACVMGGVSAGAEDGSSELAALRRFGDDVGLMFQIVDDLLDVEGDPAAMGKATQKDAAAGKLTFPGVLGVEESRRHAKSLHDSAIAALVPLGARAGALRTLSETLLARKA